MSRQLDVQREQKEATRRDALVRALEFGIVGALQTHGIQLRGITIKYGDFDCLLTVKVTMNDVWMVAFVSSDSMMNCLLRLDAIAARQELKWSKDKYQPSER